MRNRTHLRLAAWLLLGAALFWALPLPYARVGGIGNYDGWRLGPFGWAHCERLQPEFRFFQDSADWRTEFDGGGIALTVGGSVMWCGLAAWRLRGKAPPAA